LKGKLLTHIGLSVFHQLVLHPVKIAKEESFSAGWQNCIEKKYLAEQA